MKGIKHKAALELSQSVTSFFRRSYEQFTYHFYFHQTNKWNSSSLWCFSSLLHWAYRRHSLFWQQPSWVSIIHSGKKKKQVAFAKHSFLARYTVVTGEKCHTPLFPGADKSRRNTECSLAVGYIAFSSRAFSAVFWPKPFFVFIAFLFFGSACVNLAIEISDAPNWNLSSGFYLWVRACVWVCACVCVCFSWKTTPDDQT